MSAVGNPATWDFLIDTVAFNQNIIDVIAPGYVPPTPPVPGIILPATPPVEGHRHGRKRNGHDEIELVEVNFGDDVNDIRGSVVVMSSPVPEPTEWLMLLAGLAAVAGGVRRRRRASGLPLAG